MFRHSKRWALVTSLALFAGAAPVVAHGSTEPQLPAFPGAEGFGAMTTGGRGGEVYRVTTLEPFGEGSLGAALDPEVCEPRIVVFRVSGVIENEFDLTCGDITIAGQTAPGAGITIRGRIDAYGAEPGGNIIIRHLRVRPGEPRPDTGSFHDAIQLSNNSGVILDHVSASWAADEVVDLFENTGDITVQWSTIEASRTEGHPDGQHNYGMIVGPGVGRVSIHHVLFAHHRSRCPAVATGPAEIVNNVVYDCQDGFVHHNPADGEFHIVGNTFQTGPNVDELTPVFFDDEDPGDVAYYLAANRIDDPGVFEGEVDDIWAEPFAHPGFEFAGGEEYAIDDPSDFAAGDDGYVPVTVQDAEAAYSATLEAAGAFPRDAITAQTVQDVTDRSGDWGVTGPTDLLAGLAPADPPADEDNDGMADAWEADNGLDPADGDDHATVMDSGYTAIEEYVNELADELVSAAPAAEPAAGGEAAEGTDDDGGVGDAAGSAEDQAAGEQVTSAPGRTMAAVALALSIVAIVLSVVTITLVARAGRRTQGQ